MITTTLRIALAICALRFAGPVAPPKLLVAHLEDAAVCFDSPVEISWEAIARSHFHEFPLDAPNKQLLHDRWMEVAQRAEISYSAPLPPTLERLHYALFAESEVSPLRPNRLRGVVAYSLDTPDSPPTHVLFYGSVCAPLPSQRTKDAGFVAVSPKALDWHVTPVPVRYKDSRPHVTLPIGTVSLPEAESGLDQVRSAYLAEVAGTGYKALFVRRQPDDTCHRGCCTFAYEIFSVTAGLPRLLTNAYACDL